MACTTECALERCFHSPRVVTADKEDTHLTRISAATLPTHGP